MEQQTEVEFNAPVMETSCPYCSVLLTRVFAKAVNGVPVDNPADETYAHDIEACRINLGMEKVT